MTLTAPSDAATTRRHRRQAGYVAAIVVNVLLLVAANLWPGWERLPFLTAETTQVMTAVNASLVVTVLANALYVVRDPAWVRALGDIVTTSVGLVAVVRVWQVFPIDAGAGWVTLARTLLVIALVGSVIGIVAALVRLVRSRRRPVS